ncbi:MAG: RNA polymerase sigma factor, partial [Gaiellales bacterium]
MAGDSDEKLVRAIRAGSREAASELFTRHYRSVWKAAFAIGGRRSLADDATQETFVRLIERIDQYDDRRPLRPWLNRIAANRVIDLLRRERRERPLDDTAEGLVEWEAVADSDGAFVARMATLDIERRAVVVLRYGLDLGPGEIAAVLGVPVGTVNSRLARALGQLREEVDSHA